MCVLFVLAFINVVIGAASEIEGFRETLTMRPLPDGRLHALFTFDLTAASRKKGRDTDGIIPISSYVPRSLIQVGQSSQAKEIHLAINAGRWNYNEWGMPTAEPMVGTGAELRATLYDSVADVGSISGSLSRHVKSNWRKLTANLAGLFCASLDALDEQLTVLPFTNNVTQPAKGPKTQTVQAMLSSESICTENLSTLLKLLPCKSTTGLASLLKPHRFFQADFHGLSLHLIHDRQAGAWHVKINFQAVFAPAIKSGTRGKRDWSFEKVFGTRLKKSCPLAESSSVTVLAPQSVSERPHEAERTDFRVWPIVMHPDESRDLDEDESISENERLLRKAERFAHALQRQGYFTFDTRNSVDLNVEMNWPGELVFRYGQSAPKEQSLSASRILSGYGQERGTVELTLRNNDPIRKRMIIYHEVLPWFVTPYLHTLATHVIPDEYDETEDNVVRFADDVAGPALQSLNYTPSVPRQKPFHMQARLRVPPQSTVRLVFEYEKAFMRFAEHPPDAHRGFDVAPAVVELEDGSMLYTSPALVEVAVPDFSMPYNVIIFTSTVIALCAGSILNNLIRLYTDVLEETSSLM
jgi:phosphatidylinositol glycan class T